MVVFLAWLISIPLAFAGALLADAAASTPWWVGAITGTAGTTVVLAYIANKLWNALEESRKEVSDITKESIAVITKLLQKQELDDERQKQFDADQQDIRVAVMSIVEHNKAEVEWWDGVTAQLNRLFDARKS